MKGHRPGERMSSTAFSALQEAYENDSFCRGCRAIALAGRDFETHSTILPVLVVFFFRCAKAS